MTAPQTVLWQLKHSSVKVYIADFGGTIAVFLRLSTGSRGDFIIALDACLWNTARNEFPVLPTTDQKNTLHLFWTHTSRSGASTPRFSLLFLLTMILHHRIFLDLHPIGWSIYAVAEALYGTPFIEQYYFKMVNSNPEFQFLNFALVGCNERAGSIRYQNGALNIIYSNAVLVEASRRSYSF